MENPIRKVRKSMELNVADFSIALGISRDWVYMMETGQARSISPQVQQKLIDLGFAGGEISADYEKWKTLRKQEILEKKK